MATQTETLVSQPSPMPKFPLKTEALVVQEPKAKFTLTAITLDEVRADEVLVEMRYSGICHTVNRLHFLGYCPTKVHRTSCHNKAFSHLSNSPQYSVTKALASSARWAQMLQTSHWRSGITSYFHLQSVTNVRNVKQTIPHTVIRMRLSIKGPYEEMVAHRGNCLMVPRFERSTLVNHHSRGCQSCRRSVW